MNLIEKYSLKLNKQVQRFEKNNGNLTEFWQKQFFENLHIMNLEDVFFSPDLTELEKYEKFLNGGN